MNMKLAMLVVLILAGTLVWTFAAPYIQHWKARKAATRRRVTEGRRR